MMPSRDTSPKPASLTVEEVRQIARANGYDLAADPRCLWGWGPDGKSGCTCRFGHACFRPFGHPGKCWDAGESRADDPCNKRQRPKDWDAKGRAEANV